MPKKRIRVKQVPLKLVIKNTQVVLQQPGYWVDGKWMDGTKAQMQEYYKFLEYLSCGDWYEKFWERRGMTPPSRYA
jgi:hypothetical protein